MTVIKLPRKARKMGPLQKKRFLTQVISEILQKYGIETEKLKVIKKGFRWYVQAVNPEESYLERAVAIEMKRYEGLKRIRYVDNKEDRGNEK